jgi:hypothetical protein
VCVCVCVRVCVCRKWYRNNAGKGKEVLHGHDQPVRWIHSTSADFVRSFCCGHGFAKRVDFICDAALLLTQSMPVRKPRRQPTVFLSASFLN